MLQLWAGHVQSQILWISGRLEALGEATMDNRIFTYREVAARGRHRFDLRLDCGPYWRETCLRERLEASLKSTPWMPVVRRMLGEQIETIVSVVYAYPGADAQVCCCPPSRHHGAEVTDAHFSPAFVGCGDLDSCVQAWHADGPPLPPGETDPYAICVFVPLVSLTASTGCTQFWPGTHQHAHLLGFGPAAEVLETAKDTMVATGSAIMYDYRVLHRGLANTSMKGRRDILQIVYHTSRYREDRNYASRSLEDGPSRACTDFFRHCVPTSRGI
jgi:Phytanoyl-CoA dioxygenase (PhyH)